jgi:hypothetical protein
MPITCGFDDVEYVHIGTKRKDSSKVSVTKKLKQVFTQVPPTTTTTNTGCRK